MAVATFFDVAQAAVWAERLKTANDALATRGDVPDEVGAVVTGLADEILAVPREQLERLDPYLFMALQHGALAAVRALSDPDAAASRRLLRIALEQMRQAVRDFYDESPVAEDQPIKEVARWLAGALAVPQQSLAELLGTEVRTVQRWLSVNDPAEPHGEKAVRLRATARMVNHLRHALTGPGVIQWFERARDELDGRAPVDVLGQAEKLPLLMTLASRARSTTAS